MIDISETIFLLYIHTSCFSFNYQAIIKFDLLLYKIFMTSKDFLVNAVTSGTQDNMVNSAYNNVLLQYTCVNLFLKKRNRHFIITMYPIETFFQQLTRIYN